MAKATRMDWLIGSIGLLIFSTVLVLTALFVLYSIGIISIPLSILAVVATAIAGVAIGVKVGVTAAVAMVGAFMTVVAVPAVRRGVSNLWNGFKKGLGRLFAKKAEVEDEHPIAMEPNPSNGNQPVNEEVISNQKQAEKSDYLISEANNKKFDNAISECKEENTDKSSKMKRTSSLSSFASLKYMGNVCQFIQGLVLKLHTMRKSV